VQSEICSVEFDRPGAVVGAEWRTSNSGKNEETKVSGSDCPQATLVSKLKDLRIKEISRFSLVSCTNKSYPM
jgi:hypothetical protein